jgi:hypothetical protein
LNPLYDELKNVFKTISGMGGRGMKENGVRGEFKIHFKNFYKCHNVPPPTTTIKKNKMS